MDRAAGILLHPTSLPSPSGVGDLGPSAYRFVDWLAAEGIRIWQVLPLGPVGFGESPYALFSAFAGNPLLISLEEIGVETPRPPAFPDDRVDYDRVQSWKMGALRRAFKTARVSSTVPDPDWLDTYARFMALKAANHGASWRDWDPAVKPDRVEVEFQKFLQREFLRQWGALKSYCAERHIRIMGDVPIYVALDSADVWARPDLFRFDVVSGVPPDYFSATGQLWGNPIYRWDRMAKDGYAWWVARMRAALEIYDFVRVDHFRGLEAYWEVPATESTAVNGQWVKGPGADFFRTLQKELGSLPLVAENLGVITPEVEALREQFRLPGMAVLQFAFGSDPQSCSFLPHNFVRNIVAYTGTHDNDTLMGWWTSDGGDSTRSPEEIAAEKARVQAYFDTNGSRIHWPIIRALLASVADTVIFPMQDVLGLGSEARMNTPSVAEGNWRWRMTPAQLETLPRLRDMVELYGRAARGEAARGESPALVVRPSAPLPAPVT